MKRSIAVALVFTALIASAAMAGVPLHRRPAHTRYTFVTLDRGNAGRVKLLTALSSETSHVGDPVSGELLLPWTVDGQVVLPAGTRVEGRVGMVEPKGRLKHNAKLSLVFNDIVIPGHSRVSISSRPILFAAGGETQRDLLTVGAGGAAGAVIGAITGNTTRGALVGAAAGGGAALAHKGDAVELPVGTGMRLRLLHRVKVPVRWDRA